MSDCAMISKAVSTVHKVLEKLARSPVLNALCVWSFEIASQVDSFGKGFQGQELLKRLIVERESTEPCTHVKKLGVATILVLKKIQNTAHNLW